MRRQVYAGLAFGALLAAAPAALLVHVGTPKAPPPIELPPLEPLAPDRLMVGVPIAPGTTLGALLGEHGVPALAVREAALGHYDLARIRPDRELQLVYLDGTAEPVAVRYAPDADHTVVVEREGETWSARMEEVVYETTIGTRALSLTRSLWEDGLDAGLRPADLVRLAKLFEYEIDFNTELRAGARFSVVADIETAAGRKPRLDAIHAVRMVNDGKDITAVHHTRGDGTEGFYHPDGSGMKRPFLRSPLEFSRVTSGYHPRRYHPVLKRPRPHNGTDFGAPVGTPVRAVASGTVVYAATRGGHGKHVKLDHEGPWETSYSHLSRIRVSRGAKVRQGDIVGEVGMTGLTTGPHLHYEMWKQGRHVDPMKVELPHSRPLPASEKRTFADSVATWVPHLAPASE
ncbi:MAG: peptidoglycan DD-metalloendopeptidase family protein [Deltaproteobacteria bacterium]|nr:peptidoglycan DD-metalloendopeptidase family protein [Deltaproteobacteria bacterium]